MQTAQYVKNLCQEFLLNLMLYDIWAMLDFQLIRNRTCLMPLDICFGIACSKAPDASGSLLAYGGRQPAFLDKLRSGADSG